jgi:nitroreductase
MEFNEVISKRRMVRHFTQEPVPPDALDRILYAACHAPSAGYTQGQYFVVITRPDLKAGLAELCGEEFYLQRGWDPWISEAPVLVVPCTSEEAYHRRYREPDKAGPNGEEIEWPVPYWHMDIG